LALTLVIASRHSGARARHRGTRVLIEGCAVQIANAADIAALSAVFFAIESSQSSRLALFALPIIACAAFLTWMRRVTA
jgi:hypothetical protein